MDNKLVQIADFPKYYIDQDGNVYNKQLHKLKYIKNRSNIYVCLRKNGQYVSCRVDRLLANAFIPNPNNYTTLVHKNDIKDDIRLDNLCWIDEPKKHNDTKRIIAFDCFDEDENYITSVFIEELSTKQLDLKSLKNAAKKHTLYKNCYWKAIRYVHELFVPFPEDCEIGYIDTTMDNKILHESIVNALKKYLNVKQYNFVMLYFFEGYTFKAIGEMHNISKTRVVQIINRALRILKDCKEIKDLK